MRKVLVLGSAGFLMSNLMRYVLYRTKEYGFVSVDWLRGAYDSKNIYVHRNHLFHIGNAGDNMFMDKLIHMEKPDIIVIGTTMFVPPRSIVPLSHMGISEVVLPTSVVCQYVQRTSYGRCQVIRLAPDNSILDMGNQEMWNYVESMVLDVGGTVLRLPICFGRRGNGHFEAALGKAFSYKGDTWHLECDTIRKRHAYVEDVASMVWFLMEHPHPREVVRMPALGCVSILDMIAMSSDVHGFCADQAFTTGGKEDSGIVGWAPDSDNIRGALVNTAKWYSMNPWVFKNYP